jgi:hypothetical protein
MDGPTARLFQPTFAAAATSEKSMSGAVLCMESHLGVISECPSSCCDISIALTATML